MTVVEIKKIATARGLATKKMKKSELIHAIQKQEGNAACFGTSPNSCGQADCLWRKDCTNA